MSRDVIGGDAWPVEPEPDEALVEAVRDSAPGRYGDTRMDREDAICAIAAVRAYDAERERVLGPRQCMASSDVGALGLVRCGMPRGHSGAHRTQVQPGIEVSW